MTKDFEPLYENEDGYLVFRQGCDVFNDDWIKELERRKGNPEQKAYEALKKERKKGKKGKDKKG